MRQKKTQILAFSLSQATVFNILDEVVREALIKYIIDNSLVLFTCSFAQKFRYKSWDWNIEIRWVTVLVVDFSKFFHRNREVNILVLRMVDEESGVKKHWDLEEGRQTEDMGQELLSNFKNIADYFLLTATLMKHKIA